jgi:hypothetical protein
MSHRNVVHSKRSPYNVYIGRPSKWGNPFTITAATPRAAVIAMYEEYLRSTPELMAALPELRGKILGCWCAPLACHGDVLARLASEVEG